MRRLCLNQQISLVNKSVDSKTTVSFQHNDYLISTHIITLTFCIINHVYIFIYFSFEISFDVKCFKQHTKISLLRNFILSKAFIQWFSEIFLITNRWPVLCKNNGVFTVSKIYEHIGLIYVHNTRIPIPLFKKNSG